MPDGARRDFAQPHTRRSPSIASTCIVTNRVWWCTLGPIANFRKIHHLRHRRPIRTIAQRLREGVPDAVREEGAIPTLAELAEPKFLPVSLTASPVEIKLPNGGSVRLPIGVGEAVLVKVIEAVGALRPKVGTP